VELSTKQNKGMYLIILLLIFHLRMASSQLNSMSFLIKAFFDLQGVAIYIILSLWLGYVGSTRSQL
jgi:hypothetical protein